MLLELAERFPQRTFPEQDQMGHLNGCRYLLHDRDTKFCPEFRETLGAGV